MFRTALSAPATGRALDDPYAPLFLTARQRVLARALTPSVTRGLDRGLSGLFTVVAGRTHFFDDAIRGALARGVRQVVILGAGYDSRALRLGDRAVRVFEVDHPATQADKRARLATMGLAPGIAFVPADLVRGDAVAGLERAGHDPTAPTFFLWEGGTMYFEEARVREILRALAGIAAPGSQLAFDSAARSMERFCGWQRGVMRVASAIVALGGEPVRFRSDPGSLRRLLAEAGFTVREIVGADELFARYLRGSFLHAPAGPLDHAVLAERTS